MPLPTFFVIGAAKAGTSSLHLYLDQHPQIQMSSVKEPRFFAGPENGLPYPPDRISGLEEYEALFDGSIEVRGEASTDYAAHPRRQGAPERIKEFVPNARFIYLVRDPIERTLSHYRMGVALMGERRPLAEALGEPINIASQYVASSLYASQLELYLRHFPQERMLIVDQAELLANRRSTLGQIFAFLEVDQTVDSSEFEEELLSSRRWRTYSPRYLELVNRYVTPSLRWVPRGVRRSVRGSIESVLWPPLETPKVDDQLRSRLMDLYGEEIERLRLITGKTFAGWSV